jgi:cation diffusion facilitator CzcD-associated flavoprotein CzcO
MSAKPQAIVIGAGIGGIATAARLAKNGFDVTVLEKNNKPRRTLQPDCPRWASLRYRPNPVPDARNLGGDF